METAALILFTISSSLIFWLLTVCQSKYLIKHSDTQPPTTKGVISMAIILAIIMLVPYYFLAGQVCSTRYICMSVFISLAITLIVWQTKARNYRLPIQSRIICVMSPLVLSLPLNIGVIFFCQWFFPDVTTIKNNDYKYEVATTHTLPFRNGLNPTGSYVVNETPDTLYRVVVSYAFLGEEVNNHYNITDTIRPMSTAKIPCPPNYIVRPIFPIMQPTHSRTGRSRTRRSYLATKAELEAFMTGDFTWLGIKDNILVKSLDITSNPVVWEDPEKLKALEQTINNIYHNHHRRNKNKAQ